MASMIHAEANVGWRGQASRVHLVPCQNSRTVSELVFSAILKLLCATR